MTSLPVATPPATSAWEDVAHELAAITAAVGGSSALESRTGAVLLHAAGAHPAAALIDAVLGRSSAPLHAAASDRRTTAVLPSGPVMSLQLQGRPALLVPLTTCGELFGWWWLVDADIDVADPRLPRHAAALESRISVAGWAAGACEVTAALTGRGPLPREMEGQDLYVCQVRGTQPGVGQAVRRAVEVRLASRVAVAVRDSFTADVLAAGPLESVEGRVSECVREAERILGSPLTAALVGPAPDGASLPALARQAEQVADRVGTCLSVRAARRVLVDQHLQDAVQSLPLVGSDPLEALLSHDARKGTGFASALLCWLDCHGDVPAAAALLQVHVNTLRYRLRRAWELIPEALDDPGARLEVHLRLRADRGRFHNRSGRSSAQRV